MATAIKRSKQARGLRADGAIDMTKGTGRNRHTYYQPGIIDEAKEKKVGILITYRNKKGDVEPMLTVARKVHRRPLTSVFNEPHTQAGEGKYIATRALSNDGKTVTGAQHVCPFLAEDRSYATILKSLLSFVSKQTLASLTGSIQQSRLDGQHINWKGKRGPENALIVGPWVTEEKELWDRALLLNSNLRSLLRKAKSQVKGVKEHKTDIEKFVQNVGVLCRTRNTFHVATGETSTDDGGATPYGVTLEQCEFCIDRMWLTTGFDANGEHGEYCVRIAIGRRTPWNLHLNEWSGLTAGSQFAYKTDALRKRAKKTA